MTVIVSVKINEGVVMASDSASTFASGQTYLAADKIVNLVKGLPIGVMVTGAGGIGSESFATLMKDLRERLSPDSGHSWMLNPSSYTMQDVADKLREFLAEKTVGVSDHMMYLQLCGYSAGRPAAETWNVILNGSELKQPAKLQAEEILGPLWHGEQEAIDRLIFGIGGEFVTAATGLGFTAEQATQAKADLLKTLYEVFVLWAMPIQDAIDLARFLVETTISFVRFSVKKQPKTVGGPVEIATITKHEGFKWIQRKHFYPLSLNSR